MCRTTAVALNACCGEEEEKGLLRVGYHVTGSSGGILAVVLLFSFRCYWLIT